MTKERLRHPRDEADEDIYARSPLTASEEAIQHYPGSRLLSATEFKRVYLSGGNEEKSSKVVAARRSSSSASGAFVRSSHPSQVSLSRVGWSARVGSSHDMHAPRQPPTGIAAPFRPQNGVGGTARARRYLDGSVGGSARGSTSLETRMPSLPRTSTPKLTTDEHWPYGSQGLAGGATQDVAPANPCSTHKPLPHQLRSRVRLARRASSPTGRPHSGVEPPHRDQLRTEDAWLELTRELVNTKDEMRSLQQRLRHAHVLLRSLHGVTGTAVEEHDDATNAGTAISADDAAGGVGTESKPTGDHAPDSGSTTQGPRPREYWQRRAYFLMRRNEELEAESDRLRRDSRGSKVHALLQELKSVRRELNRCRRQAGAATALPASVNVLMPDTGRSEARLGNAQHSDGTLAGGPAGGRLLKCGDADSSPLEPAAGDSFHRCKDDTICDLRKRLRLLTQQYQKTDAGLVETTRQLQKLMQRHRAMQLEWEVLVGLPQELARTQQQLAATQARLIDSNREVEAFRQLFDTQASPATLRAVVDDRDHLVELLRQCRQSEWALRNEMKAAQQQLVRFVEKKYHEQYAEEQIMAHDRDAHHEETVQMLRKQVAALEHQLEVQREAYEAQLAEHAESREVELTQRLLESVRRPEAGTCSAVVPVPQSISAGALPRPTLRDKQPPTAANPYTEEGEASQHRLSAEQAKGNSMLQTASFSESTVLPTSAGGLVTGAAAHEHVGPSTERTAGESTLSSMSETVGSRTSNSSHASDAEEEETSTSSAPVLQSPCRTGDSAASLSSPHCNKAASDIKGCQQRADAAAAAVAATDGMGAASACSSAADDYGGGEVGGRDEETVEKACGPCSGSSASSSACSSPKPTLDAEGTTKQQRTEVSKRKSTSASTHTYVIDLPPPPLAVVSPVSILINRTSINGPVFPPNMRAVVHSPDVSSQGTASAANHTHRQRMLTGSSETKSNSDYLSGSSFSGSSLASSLNSPPADGDDDRPSTSANPIESEPHGGSVQPMKEEDEAKTTSSPISGAQALADATLRPPPPLADPHVEAPLSTFPAELPPKTEEAGTTSLSAAAPPANGQRSSVSLVRSAASSGSSSLLNRGAPIPSPTAVTPAVDSNSYPPRHSSSCLLMSVGNEDDLGGGTGTSRGGLGSRMHSNEHNTSFDFTHQYSGNASFDFVGLLAERHRLEDMQNTFASSRQSSAAVAAVGGAASASSSETLRNTNTAEHAAMGTGAAGVRKTPSPLLGYDILPPSKVALSTCDGNGGETERGAAAAVVNAQESGVVWAPDQCSSASLVEVSYQDDNDDESFSSNSSQRIAAVPRERGELALADAPPFADSVDGAGCGAPREDTLAEKASVSGETVQDDLAAIADLDAPSSSSAEMALSHASHTNLSSISKTLTQEEHTVLSFGFEDGGEAKLHAGDPESAGLTSDPSAAAPVHPQTPSPATKLPAPPSGAPIMAAAAALPFVPQPPRVSVPTSPRAAPHSASLGPVPLPPRVVVPLPPSAQAPPP
ncbi:hypothetical protein LSCM1_00660 [Leishmania martiniquensis]|uniref:Flagellum transition zone component n=1 Tax=Leishmania martiniquensis TaxID=1580590 RepID=A0A836GT20_9TRYP|nr:hypothetical protein LSCM1_00660 [Leishmania martiniquensis]